MATLLSGTPGVSADVVPTPIVNVPSSIPLAVKNGIHDCTRKAVGAVRDAVNALCLTGALAM